MKKVFAVVLTCVLVLSLAACGTGGTPAGTDDPSETPDPVATPTDDTAGAPDADAAQVQSLRDVLAFVDENTTMGVSGSSLRGTQSAGTLLDWAAATALTASQIQTVTADWMAVKGNDEQAAFAEKLAAVDQYVTDLQGDTAGDMLSSAGYESSAYPWSDGALDAVEAVMSAAGLR